MERDRIILIGVFGACLFALLFMVIGMATPGWWILYEGDMDDLDYYETTYYYGFNPFYTVSSECHKILGNTECKEAEMDIEYIYRKFKEVVLF